MTYHCKLLLDFSHADLQGIKLQFQLLLCGIVLLDRFKACRQPTDGFLLGVVCLDGVYPSGERAYLRSYLCRRLFTTFLDGTLILRELGHNKSAHQPFCTVMLQSLLLSFHHLGKRHGHNFEIDAGNRDNEASALNCQTLYVRNRCRKSWQWTICCVLPNIMLRISVLLSQS